ncbi:MAG: DUF1573 domain-containing protein [Chthoniobacterales bacterium]
MKRLLIFLSLLLLPAFSAFAGLTWTTTSVKIDAQVGDKTATGVFPFKNDSKKSVAITETKTSCGCTTAKLDKKTYAPGESGQITAHFDIGSRVGAQQKTITVTTDDPKEKPVELELNVEIPDPVETSAALLIWKVGATPEAQIFSVKAKPGYKIKVTDVRCSNAFFTAKLDSAKEGAAYNIAVTPVKTDAKAFGLLIVTTDSPADNPRVVYSQLQVQ